LFTNRNVTTVGSCQLSDYNTRMDDVSSLCDVAYTARGGERWAAAGCSLGRQIQTDRTYVTEQYPDPGDFCYLANPEMSDLSPGFQRPLLELRPENSDFTPGDW
jgi:hypothetical protein